MKKGLFFIMFALVALFVVACQPQVVTETVEVIKEVEVVKEVEVEVEKEVEVIKEVEVEVVKEVEVEVGSTARGSGDRLVALLWQAPSNLNPYQSGGGKEQLAASVVIEPLARFDDTGKMVPFLAAEIPTLENGGFSEDLTTITWTLKEGIMWNDGTPFTADDVVFTYEYCIDPATGCGSSNLFESIDTITAVDDFTVEIIFKEARPYPYEAFVGNAAPVIQRAQFADCIGAAAAQCTEENFKPVGTGPFVPVEFLSNDSALFVPNEFYRNENQPYFSELFMKGGGSAEDAARAVLETNEADYAWNTQVPPEVLANMELAGNGKVANSFGTCVERIMVNFTNDDPSLGDDRSLYLDGTNPHPLMSDKNIRQALSMSIDRNTLTTVGYGSLANPTCNVVPGPPAFASSANNSCLTQDIDGAKALLDEAGIVDSDGDGVREKDGIPLSLLYQTSTNAVRQQYQALIKQWWSEIGIETELRNVDASVFFGGDPSSPDTYAKFYTDVEMYTNCASGLDIQGYLGSWLPSEIPGPDNSWGTSNIPRYVNEDYVALHEELTRTGDIDQRAELIKQLNDILVQDYAMIPITDRASVSAAGNDILGFRINAWDSEMWNIAEWTRSSQ
ncbi:MAG: peptide ABC transporter substrate-binding protein [Anaerolineae bacterium]